MLKQKAPCRCRLAGILLLCCALLLIGAGRAGAADSPSTITCASRVGEHNLLIGLDNSGSMLPYLTERNRAAAAFLDALPTDTKAGILLFTTEVLTAASTDLLGVDAYHDHLLTAIEATAAVEPAGDTRYDTVIRYAGEVFQRSGQRDSRHILLLFTDGMPSQGGQTFTQAWAEDFVTDCAAYAEEMDVYLVVLNRSAQVAQGLSWLEENLCTRQVEISDSDDVSLAQPLSVWEPEELAKVIVIRDMDYLSSALLTIFYGQDNHRILNKRIEAAGITSFSLPPLGAQGVDLFFSGDEAAMQSFQLQKASDEQGQDIPWQLISASQYSAHYRLTPAAFDSASYYLDLRTDGPLVLTIVQSFSFRLQLSVDGTAASALGHGQHSFDLRLLDAAGAELSGAAGLELSLAYQLEKDGLQPLSGEWPLGEPVTLDSAWIDATLSLRPQLQYGDAQLVATEAFTLTVKNEAPQLRLKALRFYSAAALSGEGVVLGEIKDPEGSGQLSLGLETRLWPQGQSQPLLSLVLEGDTLLAQTTDKAPLLRFYSLSCIATDSQGAVSAVDRVLLIPNGCLLLLALLLVLLLWLRLCRQRRQRQRRQQAEGARQQATEQRQRQELIDALTSADGMGQPLCAQVAWEGQDITGGKFLGAAAFNPDRCGDNHRYVQTSCGCCLNNIPLLAVDGQSLEPEYTALPPLGVWLQEQPLDQGQGSRSLLVFRLQTDGGAPPAPADWRCRNAEGFGFRLQGVKQGLRDQPLQPQLLPYPGDSHSYLLVFPLTPDSPRIKVTLTMEQADRSWEYIFTAERLAARRLGARPLPQ